MIYALRFPLAVLACLLALPALAAFTDNGDGTATDIVTGLMWDKCSWGQLGTGCDGTASTHTWSAALGVAVTANSASYKGYSDWRLPNTNELESLVDIAKVSGQTLNTSVFANTPISGDSWGYGGVWSSTTAAFDATQAWFVSFSGGGAGSDEKLCTRYVRLVRSGQSFGSFDSMAIAADTMPDAFSFTDRTGVALSTMMESNTITVVGINSAASISVSGGEYRINGGVWTSVAGTVSNGNTVQVRHTSSGSHSATVNTTLSIGGVSDTFSTTTLASTGTGTGSGTLVGLAPSCPMSSLAEGETAAARCTATAYFNDYINNSSSTRTVTPVWRADDAYLAVTADGIVTALAASPSGYGRLQASYTENGVTVAEYVTIDIFASSGAATLTDLALSCPSLTVGVPTACVATAKYSNGGSRTVQAVWTIADSYLAPAGANGLVVAVALSPSGYGFLQASYTENGVTVVASATIQIVSASATTSLTGLSLSCPESLTVGTAGTAACVATAKYANGSSRAVQVTWSAADAYLTVNAGGIPTAVAESPNGYGRVQAAYTENGVSMSAVASIKIVAAVDGSGGTYTDPKTGLIWMRCAMGQTWANTTCGGTALSYSFSQARALTTSYGGFADWRLPSPWELTTLQDHSVVYPPAASIDAVNFPATPTDNFWTGQESADTTSSAWAANFVGGGLAVFSKSGSYRSVRLVRGGRTPETSTTPTGDFVDNRDGTVTHNLTGLTWMRCALGQTWSGTACTGNAVAQTYTATLTAAENLSYAARTDWRLPTVQELTSIVEFGAARPAINAAIFPSAPTGRFFSSTRHFSGKGYWDVGFDLGQHSWNEANSTTYHYVRLVSDTRNGTAGNAFAASNTVAARANASGGNANLTLSIDLSIDAAVVGQTGGVYLAASLNGQWFLHNGAGWSAWTGGALPVYFSGTLPASLNLPVVANTDVRGLMGVQIYVGYGRDADEMLVANRVLAVHTVR